MTDDPPPDTFTKVLRFTCGFITGWAMAAFSLIWFWDLLPAFWVVGAILALTFGVLAVRYGDAFWESLGDWLR